MTTFLTLTILGAATAAFLVERARWLKSMKDDGVSRQTSGDTSVDEIGEDGAELTSGARPSHVRTAEAAHAARARKIIPADKAVRSVMLPDVIKDVYDHSIDTTRKYVGLVAGSSCVRFGFKDGDLFLGDAPEEGELLPINDGDFVVVTGPSKGSNVGRRIRQVLHVDGNKIQFASDERGSPHTARDRSAIVAKITHILA